MPLYTDIFSFNPVALRMAKTPQSRVKVLENSKPQNSINPVTNNIKVLVVIQFSLLTQDFLTLIWNLEITKT